MPSLLSPTMRFTIYNDAICKIYQYKLALGFWDNISTDKMLRVNITENTFVCKKLTMIFR